MATAVVSVTMGSLGYEPSLGAVAGSDGEGVRAAFVSGLNRAFLVAAGLTALAAVLSVLRGETRRATDEVAEPAGKSRPSYSPGSEE